MPRRRSRPPARTSSSRDGSPGLASGELRGALGAAGQLIPDAAGADVVVLVDVAARTATVQDGSAVEAVDAIDPTRRFGRVSDGGEALPGDAGAAIDRALVAISADLVGICQRAQEMTVEYVKERKQFGVPVGSFQAVQHKAAQMLLETEGSRAATLYAAWTADAEPERLPAAAAMAKAWSSDAGRSATVGRDPAARRHRLHVGGRRPLAVQARAARCRAARRRRHAPRPRRRAACGGRSGRAGIGVADVSAA